MIDTDNNSHYKLEMPRVPNVPQAAEAFLEPQPAARDTVCQASWKEARRLGLFSGTFGIMTGLIMGIFTHLAAFWMTGQVPDSPVRNIFLYCVFLGILGVASGGLVGAASGAWKAWRDCGK